MDVRTQKKLAEITRKTNSHLMRSLVKQERPMKETQDLLESASKDGKLSLGDRNKIKRMLSSYEIQKALNKVSTSIDENVQDMMGKRLDGAIARAKKRGLLPEPDMNEYNAYMKKIHKGKI